MDKEVTKKEATLQQIYLKKRIEKEHSSGRIERKSTPAKIDQSPVNCLVGRWSFAGGRRPGSCQDSSDQGAWRLHRG